jgi:hypothetical protein
VAAFPVVKHLDAVEHTLPCLFARAVDFTPDALLLQVAEEGFGNRVVFPKAAVSSVQALTKPQEK